MIELNKKLLAKLDKFCSNIREDKNSLKLFAVIFRPDLKKKEDLEKWDIVISATWTTEKKRREAYEYIFSKLIEVFKNLDELDTFLYKVAVVNKKDPFIEAFTDSVGLVESKWIEAENFQVSSKNLKSTIFKSYIFASKPTKVPRKKK